MPAGRPTKYKVEYNEQAYKLCLLGATDKEIADFLDVNQDTVNQWKKDYPEFSESLKKGKQIADANVAQKLYHRAIGYEHPEIITATFQGQITDTMEVVKHYAPDPTAAIFWLKNRQRDKWRDKQEIESSNTNLNIDAGSGLTKEQIMQIPKLKQTLTDAELMQQIDKWKEENKKG